MNKILYTLTLCLCFVGFMTAQVPKKILVEETTQASCGPCAAQNPAFDARMMMNLDKVVVLKYQVWWPGFDPMYLENTADVDARVGDYLGPNAAPNIYVNGGQPEALSALSQARINDLYANQTSPISIDLDHNINDATGEVDVEVTITNQSASDLPPNTYRLIVALQEDEINFPSPPGSNGETEFVWVMRKMLPDANGTMLMDGLAAGESVTFQFSQAIPWYTKDLGFVAATAWVENPSTREVLQAEHSAHKALVGDYPDLASSYNISGYDGYCDSEVDAVFEVRNDGTSEVTSFDINAVGPDGSLTLVESWTGNLAVGASETVTIAGLQLGLGGNSLSAVITNIDGRPDRNGHNALQDNTVYYTISPDPFAEEIMEGFDITVINEVPANMLFEEAGIPIVTANSTHIGGFNDNLGGFGNSDGAVWIDFPVAAPGSTASFLFEKVDLTNSVETTMDFAYAYALRGTNGSDRVIIEASTDCGATFTTIWDVRGSDVTTAPATPTNTRFFPRPNQWASQNIDISQFDGEAEVLFRFRGISGGAQAFWFDDIVVMSNGSVSVDDARELTQVTAYPNPATDFVNVDFEVLEATSMVIEVTDISGRTIDVISNDTFAEGSHTVTWRPTAEGVYLIQMTSATGVVTRKVSVVR